MNDPKQIFAQRLTQARKMRGLSLRALSEKLEGQVSHNALHKYEMGSMMPDASVLMAVADVLQQDVDFFFREPGLKLEGLQFRKASKLGVKEELALRERAVDHSSGSGRSSRFWALPTPSRTLWRSTVSAAAKMWNRPLRPCGMPGDWAKTLYPTCVRCWRAKVS